MHLPNWPFVLTLGNSIIGVSILAMPFCFKQCGIVLGMLLLFASTWLTLQSCELLMRAGIASRRKSYSYLALHTHGYAGKLLVELCMIGLQVGTCIAFFVVIGDLGPAIISKLLNVENTSGLRLALMSLLGLFVALPLGLLRNVGSLSSVSALSICFYSVFVLYVFLVAWPSLWAGNWLTRVAFWRPEGIFQCLPIFSMAFACQTQLFILYEELPEPSMKTMSSVISSAVNLCTAAYLLVGFFGYVAYSGMGITGDILTSLQPSIISDCLKLGFVLSIALSFPLVIFPCRASIFTLCCPQHQRPRTHENDMSTQAISMPELHFNIITVTIVISTLIIGILVPNVEFVLGLSGSTVGSLICYILPTVFFMKVMAPHAEGRNIATLVLVIGATLLLVCTYATLQAQDNVAPEVRKSELHVVPGNDIAAENKLDDVNQIQIPVDTASKSAIVEHKDGESLQQKPVNEVPADNKDNIKESQGQPAANKNKEADDEDKRQEPVQPLAPKDKNKDEKASNVKEEDKQKEEDKVVAEKEKEPVVVKKELDGKLKNDPPDTDKRQSDLSNIHKGAEKDSNVGAEDIAPEAGADGKVHVDGGQPAADSRSIRDVPDKSGQQVVGDRKQEEILERLEQHQEEQKKLLAEQKEVLAELKKHQLEEHHVQDQEKTKRDVPQESQDLLKQIMQQNVADDSRQGNVNVGQGNQIIGQANLNVGQVNQNVGQANQNAVQNNQNIGQANQNAGQNNQNVGQANQNVGQNNQNVGQANQNAGQNNQNIGQANQNVGQNNQNVGQVNQNVVQNNQNIGQGNQNVGPGKLKNLDQANQNVNPAIQNVGQADENVGQANNIIDKSNQNGGQKGLNVGQENLKVDQGQNVGQVDSNVGQGQGNVGHAYDNLGQGGLIAEQDNRDVHQRDLNVDQVNVIPNQVNMNKAQLNINEGQPNMNANNGDMNAGAGNINVQQDGLKIVQSNINQGNMNADQKNVDSKSKVHVTVGPGNLKVESMNAVNNNVKDEKLVVAGRGEPQINVAMDNSNAETGHLNADNRQDNVNMDNKDVNSLQAAHNAERLQNSINKQRDINNNLQIIGESPKEPTLDPLKVALGMKNHPEQVGS